MNKSSCLFKSISLFTSCIFLLTNSVFPYPAKLEKREVGPSDLVSDILSAIPPKIGTIRPHQPTNPADTNRILIHVQDIHANEEAQRHIGRLIETLQENGLVDLVGLEGAFEEINLSSFREFPHRKAVEKVADYLFKKQKINGPIYSALTSNRAFPLMWGIDDEVHYEAHVAAYREGHHHQNVVLAQIQNDKVQLDKEKIRHFKSSLRRFDQMVQAFREEQLPLGDYVRGLHHLNPSSKIINDYMVALELEQALNFQQVESDRDGFLQRLVPKLNRGEKQSFLKQIQAMREGKMSSLDFYGGLLEWSSVKNMPLDSYPELYRYCSYLKIVEGINANDFYRSIQKLEKELYAKLASSRDERHIVKRSRDLYLNEQLVTYSLTIDEWEEMKSKNDLSLFSRFYEEAEKRDRVMARNLSRLIDIHDPQITVLVTGGFHAKGIQKHLRGTNPDLTILSFVPRVSKIEDHANYLSLFAQEKTPLDHLFAGKKLTLSRRLISNWSILVPFLKASVINLKSKISKLSIPFRSWILSFEFDGIHNFRSIQVQRRTKMVGFAGFLFSLIVATKLIFPDYPVLTKLAGGILTGIWVASFSPLATVVQRILFEIGHQVHDVRSDELTIREFTLKDRLRINHILSKAVTDREDYKMEIQIGMALFSAIPGINHDALQWFNNKIMESQDHREALVYLVLLRRWILSNRKELPLSIDELEERIRSLAMKEFDPKDITLVVWQGNIENMGDLAGSLDLATYYQDFNVIFVFDDRDHSFQSFFYSGTPDHRSMSEKIGIFRPDLKKNPDEVTVPSEPQIDSQTGITFVGYSRRNEVLVNDYILLAKSGRNMEMERDNEIPYHQGTIQLTKLDDSQLRNDHGLYSSPVNAHKRLFVNIGGGDSGWGYPFLNRDRDLSQFKDEPRSQLPQAPRFYRYWGDSERRDDNAEVLLSLLNKGWQASWKGAYGSPSQAYQYVQFEIDRVPDQTRQEMIDTMRESDLTFPTGTGSFIDALWLSLESGIPLIYTTLSWHKNFVPNITQIIESSPLSSSHKNVVSLSFEDTHQFIDLLEKDYALVTRAFQLFAEYILSHHDLGPYLEELVVAEWFGAQWMGPIHHSYALIELDEKKNPKPFTDSELGILSSQKTTDSTSNSPEPLRWQETDKRFLFSLFIMLSFSWGHDFQSAGQILSFVYYSVAAFTLALPFGNEKSDLTQGIGPSLPSPVDFGLRDLKKEEPDGRKGPPLHFKSIKSFDMIDKLRQFKQAT